MGSKHNKKRFFCVKYTMKPDKIFDELITLSKKKIGPNKILEYNVVLDVINKEIVRVDIPGLDSITYEKLESHYYKHYKEHIDQFIK